jgi:hypothetical protein
MKNLAVLIFLWYVSLNSLVAQDIITLHTGVQLKAKILHLNAKEVTFIPENKSDTIIIARNEVNTLHYRSGITIQLSENGVLVPAMHSFTGFSDSLYQRGASDASHYYKGYRAAKIGTLIGSIYFPVGLIPAIACSYAPPKRENLDFRDENLMLNPSYFSGYTEKAHEIKRKKVWQGFAIGTGIFFGILVFSSGVAISTF